MIQPERPPLAMFAESQFRHSFADLLGPACVVTQFSLELIRGTMGNILRFGGTGDDYRDFERTARAAYYFLEEGSKIDLETVMRSYVSIADMIIPALNDSGRVLAEAAAVPRDDADTCIRKYLDSYKVMYEGLLSLICGPVIQAFGIANRIQDKLFRPDKDGKIGLQAVEIMGRKLVYRENRLAVGLNSHVRNAYAHQKFRILDDAQVELWDRNWGPEIWSLEKLIMLCNQLWVNALGVTCSLILYDVNNRVVASQRGWVSQREGPRLRREELKTTISHVAAELGLLLDSMAVSNGQLCLNLSTTHKGIDQDESLYMGYKTQVRFYKRRVWFDEVRIIDQLAILLCILLPFLKPYAEVSIRVVSCNDSRSWLLVTDPDTVSKLQLQDFGREAIDRARCFFKTDTLGENTTHVRHNGEPRFVGVGPRLPQP